MSEPRHYRAPLPLMGLSYSVFGMYGGIVAVSVPQLLAARHVPESYMLLADGFGYGRHGITGSLMVDGGLSLIACALLAICVLLSQRRGVGRFEMGQNVLTKHLERI
jgi:hypothetical protein